MKIYRDTPEGARKMLYDILCASFDFTPDIIEPDPYAKLVWIAIDTKNKRVMVVYLKDNDAEEIMYKSDNWRDYLT